MTASSMTRPRRWLPGVGTALAVLAQTKKAPRPPKNHPEKTCAPASCIHGAEKSSETPHLPGSDKLRFFLPPCLTMSQNLPASFSSTSLERALDQNEAIQDTVEQSAAELCVINAVLKQEVPDHVQTGEVAQALQKTDELESRIQTSADDLAQVELDQAQLQQGHAQGRSRGQSVNR